MSTSPSSNMKLNCKSHSIPWISLYVLEGKHIQRKMLLVEFYHQRVVPEIFSVKTRMQWQI